MTSAHVCPMVGHPVTTWDRRPSYCWSARRPSRQAGNIGSQPLRCVPLPRCGGQAGQTGALNPRGVARQSHDAALVTADAGHPPEEQTLAWDTPGEWVAVPENQRQELCRHDSQTIPTTAYTTNIRLTGGRHPVPSVPPMVPPLSLLAAHHSELREPLRRLHPTRQPSQGDDTMTTQPTPCRFCGRPAFTRDDTGPLHLCCAFWIEHEGRSDCPACRTSEALRRRDDSIRVRPVERFSLDRVRGAARRALEGDAGRDHGSRPWNFDGLTRRGAGGGHDEAARKPPVLRVVVGHRNGYCIGNLGGPHASVRIQAPRSAKPTEQPTHQPLRVGSVRVGSPNERRPTDG